VTIDGLLSRLDGVRQTGHGKYVARCPAHNDRSPSLAIKECDDGKALLHCFAGCDIEDVVSALGLTFADLMPKREENFVFDSRRRTRKRQRVFMSPADALITMDQNALVVAVIGSDILEHRTIDEPTWGLLAKSVERIGAARDVCCPARYRK
jgi:hypothetical protein